ncbi:hypothetical protein FGO68_gene7705 [Halteria grandinella]|uniref:DNA-directed RNA polymerase III subunit RPC3 n=1 Tax=Halteria grandinella TaxID=5974 RepID=A0A8J8NRN2_HALGN|nr:hypothetical protein FGO68_gene7705 [Halteria grandinella]
MQFVKKISFDHKLQSPVYSFNFSGLFATFRHHFLLTLLEAQHSKYHARVLRVLHSKGFLEEKDLIQFCLLDIKQSRTIINQLLSEGFIQSQEVVVKQQGKMQLYGVNERVWRDRTAQRVGKACLNVIVREGSLGSKAMMAFEFNHLFF